MKWWQTFLILLGSSLFGSFSLFSCNSLGSLFIVISLPQGVLGETTASFELSSFSAEGEKTFRQVASVDFPISIEIKREGLSPVLLRPDSGLLPVGAIFPFDLQKGESGSMLELSVEGGWVAAQMIASEGTLGLSGLNYRRVVGFLEKEMMEFPFRSLVFLDQVKFRQDLSGGRVNSFSFRTLEMGWLNFEEVLPFLSVEDGVGEGTSPDLSRWVFSDWNFTLAELILVEGDGVADAIGVWLPVGVFHFFHFGQGLRLSISYDPQKNPTFDWVVGGI